MTLPDFSPLGLESSAPDRAAWLKLATDSLIDWVTRGPDANEAASLLRDIARLITALSEARAELAEVRKLGNLSNSLWVDAESEIKSITSTNNELTIANKRWEELWGQATAREAAARETIATLTAENAELTRRAADAYMLARQPAPEPVDSGGNDDTWRGL